MITKVPAKKIGMTTGFDERGNGFALTLLEPLPVWVLQLKDRESDGYPAVRLAYDETTQKHVNEPQRGELKKAGIRTQLRKSYEIRLDRRDTEVDVYPVGEKAEPEKFCRGWRKVDVTGTTKGRGFAGVMRRHGFHGQDDSHGTHLVHRTPAANGASDPSRVFPGVKRPGQMGNRTTTIENLKVYEYREEMNVLAVMGGVPGPRGNVVMLEAVEVDEDLMPDEIFTTGNGASEETGAEGGDDSGAATAEETESGEQVEASAEEDTGGESEEAQAEAGDETAEAETDSGSENDDEKKNEGGGE